MFFLDCLLNCSKGYSRRDFLDTKVVSRHNELPGSGGGGVDLVLAGLVLVLVLVLVLRCGAGGGQNN
jgi:hypothetical protein